MSKIRVDVLETRDGTKTVNVADLGTATASNVANTPAGNIAATTVQDAIDELDSEKFPKTGGSLTGDVTLTGTGRRIRGLFGAIPVASRTLFQTSVADDSTTIGIIPNGTATSSYYSFSNSSDPDNSAYGYIGFANSHLVIVSTSLGSSVKLPVSIDGRLAITTSGDVLATGGALGYGIGGGGTVTQATSKSTAVTLNKPSGTLTMHNQSLAAGATVIFAMYNAFIVTGTTVAATLRPVAGTDIANYHMRVVGAGLDGVGNPVIFFSLANISAGALAETVIIDFAIIRVSTS